MTDTSSAALVRQRMRDAPSVSLVTATAIAVADIIGIGVFTSLGFQIKDIPSPFSLLALWVVGGIVALCGALSYSELAAAFPRSGGEYNYLSRIFHPAAGFLAGWVSATVGFAAPIALAAMAFGDYFRGVVPGAPPLLLGLLTIWIVSLVHLSGVQRGSKLQNISTLLKVALILCLIIAGLCLSERQPISFAPSLRDFDHMSGGPFAVSLVFVLYSYSGWNAPTYIASEVRDPQRTLLRSIIGALLVVMALYIFLNAVFLITTPMAEMAGNVDVGLIAGRYIFGEFGGRIVGALICLGLVSAISSMIWVGPRVSMVMGEDLPVLRFLSRKTRNGVPASALLFQVAVATLLLITNSFEGVLNFIQFSLTFCSFLTVLGVIMLRYTQPALPRPYRTWAYPLPPLIFLSFALFVMYYLLMERPVQSLAGLATMLAGLLIYAASQAASRRWSNG